MAGEAVEAVGLIFHKVSRPCVALLLGHGDVHVAADDLAEIVAAVIDVLEAAGLQDGGDQRLVRDRAQELALGDGAGRG